MRTLLYFFFTLLGLLSYRPTVSGQCTDCEVMVCDGVNCDDGSSADGVQTSRKCGCGSEISGACATVEVDMRLNPFYDPSDPDCSLVFTTQEQGNYLIYFMDDACQVPDCTNPDFTVSGGASFSGFPSSGVFSVMVCKEGGNAGRRDFSFAVSCSTVENCVNLIDDDGDSFADCDDSDCSLDTNCSYTSTTGGIDGGLESNNRLAQKIARRNFMRTKRNYETPSATAPGVRFIPNGKARGGTLQLADFIPEAVIPGAASFISSPTDLVGITNATEVFAVDVYKQQQRIATVFSTLSENGVYDHTKFICDRLHGARIEQIWEHPVNGTHPFIITKFTRPNGITEYACNFSFFQTQEGLYQLESHWNIGDYTPGETYANFQIWANNLLHLEEMVRAVMKRIEAQSPGLEYNFTGAPDLFVRSLNYRNGMLNLDIINKSGATQLDLRGEFAETETADARPFHTSAQLEGSLHEQVQVATSGVYNMGLGLYHEQTHIADGVFVSDGAWGVDYQVGGAMIYDYEVTPGDLSNIPEEAYAVERDLILRGDLKDYVAAYRALNPAFRPVYLDDYNTLSFKAKGTGDLEITIVKDGIEDWEQQMKTAVRLTSDLREFRLSLDRFYAPDGAKDWSDVKMIVFTMKGDGENGQRFSLEVQDLAFTQEAATASALPGEIERSTVYPNPLVTTSSVLFRAPQQTEYVFQLLSASGIVVQENRGNTTTGINELSIVNNGYTPGIYFYTISLANGEVLSGKILVNE